jgi:FtsH-binding integral membrane protein
MISYVFIIYNLQTLGVAFVMTAGVFGVMSVYGFVTKRDLTGIGSILVMCAIGLFIASLVNVFLASNALSWVITYAVLGVFIGITAYETQRLKSMAYEFQGNGVMLSRVAIVGSLVLYISFINMFLAILRILGSRR